MACPQVRLLKFHRFKLTALLPLLAPMPALFSPFINRSYWNNNHNNFFSYGNVGKSRQRRSRHFAVLTY